MEHITVRTLIDNGGDSGSGIGPLKKARDFAKTHGIEYLAIGDSSIPKRRKISLIDSDDPSSTPEILVLSGLRVCDNLNNDSIAVRVRVGQLAVLFTGDAENEGDASCDPELPALEDRFQANHLLAADVYHVAHHGSYNGTSGDFMTTVSPKISVISLRANIDETVSAAIITEQGGQENHRDRSQDCSSFCKQFA